jgi:hypothetical protein
VRGTVNDTEKSAAMFVPATSVIWLATAVTVHTVPGSGEVGVRMNVVAGGGVDGDTVKVIGVPVGHSSSKAVADAVTGVLKVMVGVNGGRDAGRPVGRRRARDRRCACRCNGNEDATVRAVAHTSSHVLERRAICSYEVDVAAVLASVGDVRISCGQGRR